MALRVYSTLIRDKKDFEEVTGKNAKRGETVTMYVCGPTVYKPSHIGHMVGPVIFDTVKRYLTYLGYTVKFVVNITDVDDKLINRARELNTTVPALAARMTADYMECLKALNVTGIDQFPRATEHIAGMVEIISGLIEKGYAYRADGDVYFDVAKDKDYGKLCNRDPEQMEAGARLELNAKKRNAGDFALWKGAKPDEPKEVQFDSPFGCGRPGWHIECSCMAIKLLGETLDIHGGGLDLQFPHHENELAQSESYTGGPPDKPFARVWMHNGLLKMGTAKMAGSVGNVVNMVDLLKRHSAETVRFLLLSSHYRSPIEYSEERLDEVARALEGFYRFFERFERITGESFFNVRANSRFAEIENPGPHGQYTGPRPLPIEYSMVSPEIPGFEEADGYGGGYGGGYGFGLPADYMILETAIALRRKFLCLMDDDFNTGGAVAVLFQLANELNKFADQKGLDYPERLPKLVEGFRRAATVFKELCQILGLFWQQPPKQSLGGGDQLVAGLMQLLLDLRNNLRTEAKAAAKDNPLKKALFDQTDLIRKRLAELGVVLEDRPGGTTWRVG